MKKMKKIIALALSFMMVVAMSVAAFASEAAGTFTITAPNTDHQYEIYQIFTGDLSEGTLSNVKWGQNGIETVGEKVSAEVLAELTEKNSVSDTAKLAVIKKYAKLDTPVDTITNGQTYTATAGYYLIKDKDNSLSGKEDAYTLYIVKVVGNVAIEPKSAVPSFEKKVKDTNDTENKESEWQDSADYDIGDDVPFKLEGTVASNYDDYKTYYFAFHDTEEDGLTFNEESVRVYLVNGDSEIAIAPNKYEVTVNPGDKHTFDVVFKNLKDVEGVKAGSKIVVKYTSKLNENANIGNQGNLNTGSLEFSNNPNEEQNGDKKPETGKTPDDSVIVFTYKVVANKVDENREALPGAAFKLEKRNSEGEYELVSLVNATENDENYTITDSSKTTFEWKGIDDGDYRLTEIITPNGYNTIEPIEFTVTAGHQTTFDFGTRTDVLTSLSSGNEDTGDVTAGTLTTNVVNKKGSTLPTTGGIGTTIFYVIGSVLVLGAAVLLITKKRMSAR